MPWSACGEMPQRLDRMLVRRVEDAARPDEDVAEDRLDDADGGDVAELHPGPEPLRPRQHLDHRRPHQRAAGEEEQVLDGMDPRVVERRLVGDRQMPEQEVRRPDREGDVGRVRKRSRITAGSASTGRSSGPVSPATKHSGARSPSRMCWIMWTKKNCFSPSSWIGEATAMNARKRPSPKTSRRQSSTGVPRAARVAARR